MKSAEQVFKGVPAKGQGRGWCRRVGGDMGHTQLRIGVQGGHVDHRGETEEKKKIFGRSHPHENRPQERVYMAIRGRLVYYIGTLFPQECAQTTFFR